MKVPSRNNVLVAASIHFHVSMKKFSKSVSSLSQTSRHSCLARNSISVLSSKRLSLEGSGENSESLKQSQIVLQLKEHGAIPPV